MREDFEYYLTHQTRLVEQYDGKVIVIKSGAVLGAYDSDLEAVTKTTKEHPLGTFLVQRCQPKREIQTFHSRVTFG